MSDGASSEAAKIIHHQCSHCASVGTRDNLVRERDGKEVCSRCGWRIFPDEGFEPGEGKARLLEVGTPDPLFHCTSCNRTAFESNLFERISADLADDEIRSKRLSATHGAPKILQAIELAKGSGDGEVSICIHCGTIGSIEPYHISRDDPVVVSEDGIVTFADGTTVEQQVEETSEAFWRGVNEYMASSEMTDPAWLAGIILHNASQDAVDYLLKSEPRAVWLEVQSLDLGDPISECSDNWFRQLIAHLRKEVDGIAPGYTDFDESELDDGIDDGESEPTPEQAAVSNAFFQGGKIGDAIGTLLAAAMSLFNRPKPPQMRPLSMHEQWKQMKILKQQIRRENMPCRVVRVADRLLVAREDFISIEATPPKAEGRKDDAPGWLISVDFWASDGKERRPTTLDFRIDTGDPEGDTDTARAILADAYEQLQRPTTQEMMLEASMEAMARSARPRPVIGSGEFTIPKGGASGHA